MSLVVVCEPPGTAVSTTTGLLLAASVPAGQPVVFAECDPSGGDVAAWAELRETPGWSTAVAAGDRSWSGLRSHMQQMPSGLSVIVGPTQSGQAQVVVREAAHRFGSLLRSMLDVTTIADCGRVGAEVPVWAPSAQLVLLIVRQAVTSVGATVARVDRARETLELLRGLRGRVAIVVVGARPYPPQQLADVVGGELFGVLPDDAVGAGLVAGSWTVGRGASRSALARAARPLASRLIDTVGGVGAVIPLDRGTEVAG